MASPALATTTDLSTRGVDVSDPARAQAAIDDASARIHSATNFVWIDAETGELVANVPHIALTICCSAARRALANPLGVTQQSEGIGSYNVAQTFGNASPDVYLTRSEIVDLRKAAGISSGAFTVNPTPAESVARDLESAWVNGPLGSEPGWP